MRCFVFQEEPVGVEYCSLLDFCCSAAAELMLVVQWPSPVIDEVLRKLLPDLLRTEEVDEWPGTRLYGGRATVYRYAVTSRLCEMLKALAGGLFEWVAVGPEDPCFFRKNGQVLLVTTSHERDAYMYLTEAEHETLERDFPNLASRLRVEGGAGEGA
jgi:hypothetical protein